MREGVSENELTIIIGEVRHSGLLSYLKGIGGYYRVGISRLGLTGMLLSQGHHHEALTRAAPCKTKVEIVIYEVEFELLRLRGESRAMGLHGAKSMIGHAQGNSAMLGQLMGHL